MQIRSINVPFILRNIKRQSLLRGLLNCDVCVHERETPWTDTIGACRKCMQVENVYANKQNPIKPIYQETDMERTLTNDARIEELEQENLQLHEKLNILIREVHHLRKILYEVMDVYQTER